MQLLASEEYGLRCLVQVARRGTSSPVPIPTIAAAEGLSVEYVGKLMRVLRKSGLVSKADEKTVKRMLLAE